jgi:hypothetical protein
MKMNKKSVLFAITVFFLLLASQVAYAQTTKILFYESSKVGTKYKISTGYSSLKTALEAKGYSVSRYEGVLSREVLNNYDPDVLVIAELSKSLDADELAAVFEFVMQDGKGLFICGGTQSANQITIPFGMTIDPNGLLEDENSPVMSSATPSKDKTFFVVSSFERQDPALRLLVQGVSNVGFFGGNGISISGDAKAVATGDWDTYSPKSATFPKGSKPPIAAASVVGNGMVVLLSDADALSNERLDTAKYKYDNLKFGTNIFDWLRSAALKPADTIEMEELRTMIGQTMVEIDGLNQTIRTQKATITDLQTKVAQRDASISALSDENKALKDQSFAGINYTTWGILLLVVVIGALALVMSKKTKKAKGKEDAVGGFGYEFEGGGDAANGLTNQVGSFDEMMGSEKPKK